MTVRRARARGEAENPTCEKCIGCQLKSGPMRFCEVLGVEIWKQCCICRGGHDCYWWDLCEACQNLGIWACDAAELD